MIIINNVGLVGYKVGHLVAYLALLPHFMQD